MTPELKQAIEILQFNAIELNEFIKEELLDNPILQRQAEDEKGLDVQTTNDTLSHSESMGGIEGVVTPDGELHPIGALETPSLATAESEHSHEPRTIDWREVASSGAFDKGMSAEVDHREEQDELSYDSLIAGEKTLVDHLLEQLKFSDLPKTLLPLGHYLIHSLNSKGYLEIDVDDVLSRFRTTLIEMEDVIQLIQTFDPLGVGARNLRECLMIQMHALHPEQTLAMDIIEKYLDDLAANRLQVIAKSAHTTVDDVCEAVQVIRSLEPKPGRMFASMRDVRYIVPDVVIEEMDGHYVILVNESTAPKLYISNYYRSLLERGTQDSATEYVNRKLNAALRLIKNIEQRRNTIYRVVETILDFQSDFFKMGPSTLKPLNLKDVSEHLGIHESTVSRAIGGKYIQCKQGIFEMKYFFPSGLSGSDGEGISAERIKRRLKQLVDGENPKKPISDQDMADTLTKEGINISRRTIAKYRDELHIPGSSKRKQY